MGMLDPVYCCYCKKEIDTSEGYVYFADQKSMCRSCAEKVVPLPYRKGKMEHKWESAKVVRRLDMKAEYEKFCSEFNIEKIGEFLLVDKNAHLFAVGTNEYGSDAGAGFQKASYENIIGITVNDGFTPVSVKVSGGNSGAVGALGGAIIAGGVGALIGALATRSGPEYHTIKRADEVGFTITYRNGAHENFNIMDLCFGFDFLNVETQKVQYETAKSVTLSICTEIEKLVKSLEPDVHPEITQGQPAVQSFTQFSAPVTVNEDNIKSVLGRIGLFLEDKEWEKATAYSEQVLNYSYDCVQAYQYLLMAEYKASKFEDLAYCVTPFDTSKNYEKIVRFGDAGLVKEVKGYVAIIKERNETDRKTKIYNDGVREMEAANSESAYKQAAGYFAQISGFRDSEKKYDQCLSCAEECRKNAVYSDAMSKIIEADSPEPYEEAITLFQSIPAWKDSNRKIDECRKKIEEIKAKREQERLEELKRDEEARIAAEKAAAKKKRVTMISMLVAVAAIATIMIYTKVIVPNANYNAAVTLMNSEKYEEAIVAFEELDGYKDSSAQILDCRTAIKDREYEAALALMNSGKYEKAIVAFEELDGYKDSSVQILDCWTAIKDREYEAALVLMNSGKYEEAITAFEAISGYKDSGTQIENCWTALLKEEQYTKAAELIKKKDYIQAYEMLSNLGDYKDSVTLQKSIRSDYNEAMLQTAEVGSKVIFGTYEQDNNKSNGKEEIEWRVLAKKDDKILVISEYALDCQQYNTKYTDVTWETCSLRKWLNGTFLTEAFDKNELAQIMTTKVTADKNPKYSTSPGKDTQDKVFLLSITEAEKYFTSDSDRSCKPTAYAESQGCYVNQNTGNCWWWLRSPGRLSNSAASVDDDGSLYYFGVYVSYVNDAVRPALWINLAS